MVAAARLLARVRRASARLRVFPAAAAVGDRFSALSAGALVPAGLAGADLAELLDEAESEELNLAIDDPSNNGLRLAALLAAIGQDELAVVADGTHVVGYDRWAAHLLGATGLRARALSPSAPELAELPVLRIVSDAHDAGRPGPREVLISGSLGELLLVLQYTAALLARLRGVDPFGGSASADSHPLGGSAMTEGPATVGPGDNPLRLASDRRLNRIAGPSSLVIFGVTGDLARKKLMPAVYDLANRGLLPPGFALVGFARRDWADEDFAKVVHDAVQEHSRTPFHEDVWRQLAQGIRFVQGTFDDAEAFARLRRTVDALDAERGTMGNHAFYLSIPPKAFPQVTEQLKASGLADPRPGQWRRVVIEKPFGSDLQTARELNDVVESVFPADSVFRIDHYLGKETVQNILALRFANMLFEPIWNANFVDHVQITMAEDIGVGGRAGYYDGIGAARDVIQNHLLQLLALTAMEEPVSFDAVHLRAEKEKVLSAVRLPKDLSLATARGQYTSGGRAASTCSASSRRTAWRPTPPPRPTRR